MLWLKRSGLLLLIVAATTVFARGYAADRYTAPEPRGEEAATVPELVKTRPYKVVDIIRAANGGVEGPITDESIVAVKVVPEGDAKGFAYFDGLTTWKMRYGLDRPEDFDNGPAENCWKIVGGMTESEKLSEFDPIGEGGAAPGRSGTGDIRIKIFYRNDWGGLDTEVVRARVVLKKLIVEVDWMEGSVRRTISNGTRRRISFKPNINQEFIDAFGQAGIEVIIKDTPEKGNIHNIIPREEVFEGDLLLNRENLVDLLPEKYRKWRGDFTIFNDAASYIARRIIDKGYMDFDASRPDVIYVIGAQRWMEMPRERLMQTRGVTALFEHNKKRYNVAFVFNLAIAESVGCANKKQKIQVPWGAASLHTALHECAGHCFPIRWKNRHSVVGRDAYWGDWRYQFVGHRSRSDHHTYGKIYTTCVTVGETALDAAYYTWLRAPRLNDFSNRIGNGVCEKSRDIIRDYVVAGKAGTYGREETRTADTRRDRAPTALRILR